MSETTSYHPDYHSSHPQMHAYVDPREYSSTSVHRTRYESPRRVRDVSWISSGQQPAPNHDPYTRWYPPSEPSEFPGQVPPIAHSSPLMRPITAPSPMVGEYMTVEGNTEDNEEEEGEMVVDDDYRDDDEAIDFDFSAAPNNTRARKGARRWVGGFVQGLRKFPGLRKSSRRPPPDVAFSPGPQQNNVPQFPTISDLQLRPLTPSLITQAVEFMEPPSPQHYLHPHSVTRKPPPSATPSPAVESVPQLLSTVSEHSNERTGTQETHLRRHSSAHSHSPHTHTRPHSHLSHHSPSRSRSHSSQSTVQPVIPNNNDAQPAQPAQSPLWELPVPTISEYITVPVPSQTPPSKGLKRFLHTVEQLPWIEHEQIVNSYFPGRSSRHRRHPDSDVEGWKPALPWYNKRNDSAPSATPLYGWPPRIQKRSSQPGVQFPHGYTPVQPVFLYPSAFPPPGVMDAPQ